MSLKKSIFVVIIAVTFLLSIAGAVGDNHIGLLPSFFLPQPPPSEWESSTPESPILMASGDSILFPIEEREGNHINDEGEYNPFDLDDPSIIEKNVEYDPETGQYVITETIGGQNYRSPSALSFEDFWKQQTKQSNRQYWQQKANSQELLEGKGVVPKLYTGSDLLKTIFGGDAIDIRPTGDINMEFGFNTQRIDNPALPSSIRNQGPNFLFNMDINMGVTGKIGEKLKLDLNYNTNAIFDFDNQIKLEYIGDEDEIIQEIRAGNVNFNLPTQLITGSQNLFGIQTKLKFGRLTINSVLSQQRSQARNITIQGGAQVQEFEIEAYDYEDNRHFFLAQYFRNNYENWVGTMPYVSSPINITRLDVYVSDSRGTAEDPQRSITGLTDLAELNPANPFTMSRGGGAIPRNDANTLNTLLSTSSNNSARELEKVIQELEVNYNLQDIRDFRQTQARKLKPSEYVFDPQLGFVSINFRLNPNEIVAVAYEYIDARDGRKHQVGEFAEDIFPVDTLSAGNPDVIFLKMLKTSSLLPSHPIWNLMMKNVYSLGAFQVEQEDFRLDIYYQNPGNGDIRYIPEGNIRGQQLIRVLNLDRLNAVNQPQPDGIFDFVPAKPYQSQVSQASTIVNAYQYGTINERNGRLIFPVLEPFGNHLKKSFGEDSVALGQKYVYNAIYDSTKTAALEVPEKNRFVIKGTYKSNISSEISLGAFNIPQGSVRVTAGGQVLTEGADYTVDYNLGRVRILNDAYLNAGIPVNVSFENNNLFGLQQRTMIGTRLDYQISRDFNIGGTFTRLAERPFTPKENYGNDPIANSMVGLDLNYFSEMPWLTKVVDKLPFYDTKEPSSLKVTAEVAGLLPGHARAINIDDAGTIYIDDFEGSNNGFDVKFPYTAWSLASTPRNVSTATDPNLFPEADLTNDFAYGYNRAKIAWYQIDNFFSSNRAGLTEEARFDAANNPYAVEISQRNLFPNAQQQIGAAVIRTFDIAYFPDQRGPYNYDTEGSEYSAGLNSDGTLRDPESRWGGLMRQTPYKDFEQSNVEFIEFWLLDPFIGNEDGDPGDLYIHLGSVSEDVLKDSRAFFEQALPGPNEVANLDTTTWGIVPKIPPIVNAFDIDAAARERQDVGFDGMPDRLERQHLRGYLNDVRRIVDSESYDLFNEDPAADNFRFFRDSLYDANGAGVIERYSNFNGPDGNSPVQNTTSFLNSATSFPEVEDLDQDLSLERSESYLQYRVRLKPNMDFSDRYVEDVLQREMMLSDTVVTATDTMVSEVDTTLTWYYFRIPVSQYEKQVGTVNTRNIESIRLFMTGFAEPIVCRFAEFNFVRSNWRRYRPILKSEGEYVPDDNFGDSFFNLASVNIEQNSEREPIGYVLPPGIQREEFTNQTGGFFQQNEQSLSLEVGGLKDGEARAAFKNIDMDLRVFKRLRMFMHAESDTAIGCNPIRDGDVTGFIRLGDDFTNNYYEYEIPLQVTSTESAMPDGGDSLSVSRWVWPLENEIDLQLKNLVDTKVARNTQQVSPLKPFQMADPDRLEATITVVGNPELNKVKQVMLGVRNPKRTALAPADDGFDKCAVVWFNELRLSEFDEGAGWAGILRADMKVADLGNMTLSGNMHTDGFGTIEQRVHERLRDNLLEYNFSTNMELGKLLPKGSGVRIPMYANVNGSINTPEYDPYNEDVRMGQTLDSIRANFGSDSARVAKKQRQTRKTVRSINFTNVRKERTNTEKKPMPWDISNFSATYSYTETEKSDPIIEKQEVKKHFAELNYQYNTRPKHIYPFKKLIKGKSKYFNIIRDINFNLIPNRLGFQTDIERYTEELQLRRLASETISLTPIWNKYFFWNRRYNLEWQPTKSISLTYNAANSAIIDELPGDPGNDTNREFFKQSFRDFGRTTLFTQDLNASYTLPINKIPLFDWTNFRTRYNTNFRWQGNPVGQFVEVGQPRQLGIADTLGNTIRNTRDIQLDAEFSFAKLYNKSKYLKGLLGKSRRSNKPSRRTPKKDDKAKEGDDKKKKKKRAPGQVSFVEKLLLQPLFSIKRVSINYSDRRSTTVPGFLPRPEYLGNNWDIGAPGLGFAFGYQPNNSWLEYGAENDWFARSEFINEQFIQTRDRKLSLRARLEPYRDLNIDLTANLNYNQTRREFYKVENGAYKHLTPINEGGYSISYFTLNTLFDNLDENNISETFRAFEDGRSEISRRWAENNPNSLDENGALSPYIFDGDTIVGFYEGYGRIAIDVLVPSFIAAYTGKNPESINLNPFHQIPIPNWRVSYNGLSKLPLFKSLFTSINISHGYQSTFNINTFQSDLDFVVDPRNPFVTTDGHFLDFIVGEELAIPIKIDTVNGNYFTQYRIPNLSITEQLSPLIGVDMTWKNGLTTAFNYQVSRTLGMDFTDYQLSESRSEEFTIGVGYRFTNGFTLPFKWGGKKIKLENELSFRFDLSLRDAYTVNYSLDQDLSQDVNGIKTLRFSPTIDYVVSERLKIGLFYEYNRNVPRTSNSFPITNTRGGLRVNFSL